MTHPLPKGWDPKIVGPCDGDPINASSINNWLTSFFEHTVATRPNRPTVERCDNCGAPLEAHNKCRFCGVQSR